MNTAHRQAALGKRPVHRQAPGADDLICRQLLGILPRGRHPAAVGLAQVSAELLQRALSLGGSHPLACFRSEESFHRLRDSRSSIIWRTLTK